ncbi:MAG: hypothetical protein ACR2KB_13960, partial [Chitinophagaceae bacterium]
YGADQYTDAGRDEFFANAFLHDQPDFVAALAIIGLIAAGLSTTNAQIFALGSELRGLLKGDEKTIMLKTKIGIFVFSIIALCFSVIVIDQLVLLARVSFTGTALMAPLIILGILSDRKISSVIIFISFLALIIFLLSLIGWMPNELWGIRLDLILFFLLGISAVVAYMKGKKEKRVIQIEE